MSIVVKPEVKSELEEVRTPANEKTNVMTEQGDNEQLRKLFLGGISSTTTEAHIRAFFGQWGEVQEAIVMRDPANGRSRGFGFVTLASMEQVDAAMHDRPHVIDGKRVDSKRAVPREESRKSEANVNTSRLYVSGVKDEHTETMFAEYFSQFGVVVKVEIVRDKESGQARGFAFVTFDDHDPVDKCVMLKSHYVAGYRCDVKKALSKEEMAKAAQQDRDRLARLLRSRDATAGYGSFSNGWNTDEDLGHAAYGLNGYGASDYGSDGGAYSGAGDSWYPFASGYGGYATYGCTSGTGGGYGGSSYSAWGEQAQQAGAWAGTNYGSGGGWPTKKTTGGYGVHPVNPWADRSY